MEQIPIKARIAGGTAARIVMRRQCWERSRMTNPDQETSYVVAKHGRRAVEYCRELNLIIGNSQEARDMRYERFRERILLWVVQEESHNVNRTSVTNGTRYPQSTCP